MNNDLYTYTYFYSVHDYDGSVLTLNTQLTRNQFIRKTGIDPVTNKCIYIHNCYMYIY